MGSHIPRRVIRRMETRFVAGINFISFPIHIVEANHENDTCLGSRLVMGSAACINYAGLVKEKFFLNVSLALGQTVGLTEGVFFPEDHQKYLHCGKTIHSSVYKSGQPYPESWT